MNHFLALKIWEKDRTVFVRPEAVAAVERRGDDEYQTIILNTGDTYWVEPGQFALNILVNRTGHAGMRVL